MKNVDNFKKQAARYLSVARKNAPGIFILFLLAIYGFLGWRIVGLLGAAPSDADVSSQLQTVGIPKVNPDVVSKMEQLKDNNVSVQTLFEDARKNPFQE
jgi:hypothetical protein